MHSHRLIIDYHNSYLVTIFQHPDSMFLLVQIYLNKHYRNLKLNNNKHNNNKELQYNNQTIQLMDNHKNQRVKIKATEVKKERVK